MVQYFQVKKENSGFLSTDGMIDFLSKLVLEDRIVDDPMKLKNLPFSDNTE